MSTTMPAPSYVFLTVRGTLSTETLEAGRKLHNETAGSAPGIAAARSLGDLSHNVFTPVAGAMSNAKQGEVLFHDVWQDANGLMQFFGNPDVQKSAGKLFTERDAAVWMPAVGAFGFHLPAPHRRTERLIGMVRGKIKDPAKTIEAFRAVQSATQRDARRHGQIAHQLFIKMNPPGDPSPLEALGVDVWFDGAGMAEHYKSLDMASLSSAFSGAPEASVWQAAQGEWNEW